MEYLQRWTDEKNQADGSLLQFITISSKNEQRKRNKRNVFFLKNTFPLIAGIRKKSAPSLRFNESDLSAPLFIMECAGFQQCVAQLTNYMQTIPGCQRVICDGLRPSVRQQPDSTQPDCSHRRMEAEVDHHPDGCAPERSEDSLQPLFSSHSPFQPVSCSTPSHEKAFAPPSPWLSPSFSTFVSSPSFVSSPLSTDASFFSISPTTCQLAPPALGCSTASTPPPASRGGSPPSSASPVWRPWF